MFAIPGLCDIIGTSTMFVGLDSTNASNFQLLQGSLIIFTALLSVTFFRSKLQLYHWVGMMTVVIGLVVVGLGDVLGEDNSGDAHSVLAGDLLIVTAQIVAAIQMIVEQLFVQGLNVPPLAGREFLGFVLLELYQCTLFHGTFHLDQISGTASVILKISSMESTRYFIYPH